MHPAPNIAGMFIWPLAAILLYPMVVSAADDVALKQQIVRQSIAAYPGNCPCPYSKDRAGRNYGKRSAYSKLGGSRPLCDPENVTQEMLARHKKDNNSLWKISFDSLLSSIRHNTLP